jgi:ADP-dependent NAD(P)H-hydrate dehydratase
MSLQALTLERLAEIPLPWPPEGGDKHDRGTVLVAAGGPDVPGAAVLTGRAALRVGAGRIRLAAARASALALGLAVPEAGIVRLAAGWDEHLLRSAARALARAAADCDALVIGPGLTDPGVARRLSRDSLQANVTAGAVIDAAALPRAAEAVGFARLAGGRVVLTPHAGEMAGMMDVGKARVMAEAPALAREAAARFQAVVVLKGAVTHVATPAGRCWRHEGGVVGLATSGSGDVLAGAISGLIGRGAAPECAALWGVYLHAAAGAQLSKTMGPLGFTASDVVERLPRLLPG